jgi:polar amino acid transport system substrate-binding protein
MKYCITLASLFCTNAFADQITVQGDPWCPYTCDTTSSAPGFLVEIAKTALEAKGHKVTYTSKPWSRTLAEAREGKVTAAVGAGPGDIEGLVPTVNLISTSWCFYVRKGDSWSFKGIDSFKGKTLGVTQDYTYNTELDKYIAAGKNLEASTGDDALKTSLKKLLAKRSDIVLDDGNVLAYTTKQMGKSNELQEAGCTPPSDAYIAFTAKNPKAKDYVKIVNDAFEGMRKDGKLTVLMAKYGIKGK